MVDLKMEVYSPALELLGFLEIHNSVIWEEKAFTAGSFSVEAPITSETLALLKPENIIWIEGDTAGIIEYMQESADKDGTHITVKGRALTGILDRRILWGRYDMSGTPPTIMRSLVNDCCINPTRGNVEARKIPGLVLLNTPTGGESIRIQKTGGSLLEALEQLGETYGVAFGVRFNAEIPRMEFWTRWGRDLTVHQSDNPQVFYSTELDDVLESEYTYNSQDYRNVSLVGGEGEGNDRVYVTVEEDMEETPDVPVNPPAPPEPTKHTVTLLVDPAGGGTASGGKTVAAGVSVTVTASPSEGYTFTGWSENGNIVSASASYTFTVNSDRTLTAVFAVTIPTYTITASIDPAGSGTVTGAGQYQEGAEATLTATPAEGYTFDGWYDSNLVRLPRGYTELEYIQSSGGQYIDTGFKPNNNTRLDVSLAMTSTSKSLYCLGANDGTNFFRMFSQSGGSGIQCFYGTNSQVLTANIGEKALASQNKNTAVVGDSSYNFPQETFSINCNLFLFTDNTNGVANTSRPAAMKLYSCKIYDNGVASRDFIPCKNPAGEIGLYDVIGGDFYDNSGTGAFTAGPEIEANAAVSESETYTFAVTGDRAFVAVFAEIPQSRLPEGYTELKYIQSSGTQYISTGINPDATTKLVMDVETLSANTTAYPKYFFGSRYTTTSYKYDFAIRWTNSGIIAEMGRTSSATIPNKALSSSTSPSRVLLELDAANKTASLNGVVTAMTDNTLSTSATILLLGNFKSDNRYWLPARLYSCQIYKSGALVCDFVPCKTAAGTVGLYDLANSKFHGPAAGTLTAGPAV